MENKAYFYVLECADGSLYTGYTTDVEKRLATHNRGKGAKYTRGRLPVSLLYQEAFASKQEAMSAEALFKKRSRQSKLDYIAEMTKKPRTKYYEAFYLKYFQNCINFPHSFFKNSLSLAWIGRLPFDKDLMNIFKA